MMVLPYVTTLRVSWRNHKKVNSGRCDHKMQTSLSNSNPAVKQERQRTVLLLFARKQGRSPGECRAGNTAHKKLLVDLFESFDGTLRSS